MPSKRTVSLVVKPLAWIILLAPAVWLGWAIWRAWQGDGSLLGTDPAETIVHLSGETALKTLLATLLLGSLRDLLGLKWLVQLRRLLGLFAFFWGLVHLGSYVWLELEGSFGALSEDLAERPYVLAGAMALLSMLPLALTSTNAARRRLGRRWVQLHRLVYVAALAACVHLVWQARSDLGEALAYSAAFAAIGAQRLWMARRGSRSGAVAATARHPA